MKCMEINEINNGKHKHVRKMQGTDINKIAAELGRTPDAVWSKILRTFGGVD